MERAYLARVDNLLTHVERKYRSECRSMLLGEALTFAQAWQDWHIFHNLYRDRLVWGGGAYVDIGTNHPTTISNTLFFDKCLGWTGVCFEPQPQYHELIRSSRSCTLVPHCVLGKAQLVNMSGGGTTARVGRGAGAATECVAAGDVLRSLGFGNTSHTKPIDLLSVDVEGAEAEVLRCFPFRELGVRHVLLETNRVRDFRAMTRFFHRHGYASIETFTHGKVGSQRGYWLDNLFEFRGHMRYPGARHGERAALAADCASALKHGQSVIKDRMLAFCAPWHMWSPADSKWYPCREDQEHSHSDSPEGQAAEHEPG
jgi:FkbM family methyltransferase